MSFTEDKFIRLTRDNRLKKIVYAIKEFLASNKTKEYILDILSWFNEYENCNYKVPDSRAEWEELHNKLLKILQSENPFIEINPFDKDDISSHNVSITVILEDIRSPYNVGAIIRTADALGIHEVICTGITPNPEKNSKVAKTACKARVLTSYTENIIALLNTFKKQGLRIVALEKASTSTDIRTTSILEPIVLVLGNEEFGVSKEILEICDHIVHIPMFGGKNSLNVSVATGIALFELIRYIK